MTIDHWSELKASFLMGGGVEEINTNKTVIVFVWLKFIRQEVCEKNGVFSG